MKIKKYIITKEVNAGSIETALKGERRGVIVAVSETNDQESKDGIGFNDKSKKQ